MPKMRLKVAGKMLTRTFGGWCLGEWRFRRQSGMWTARNKWATGREFQFFSLEEAVKILGV